MNQEIVQKKSYGITLMLKKVEFWLGLSKILNVTIFLGIAAFSCTLNKKA